jgi:isopenicillin-N epimerase
MPRATRRSFLTTLASVPLVAGATAPARAAGPGAQAAAQARSGTDADIFAAARRQFLMPVDVTYCNTGTLGATPRPVVEAMNRGVETLERDLPDWPYFQADGEPLTGYQQLIDARTTMGSLINAPADEVAITQNATMGMSMLGAGLDWKAGDEVISTDHEHTGGISSFKVAAKRFGIVVKELPLSTLAQGGPEAIVKGFADAMTPRTRAIMFSHITSGLGILMPTQALCTLARERGALSLVDGAQAIGQIVVDVKALGCDAYVTSPHKWLLAPKGTGVLYIRAGVQDRFWTTLASTAWDDHAKGAFRFMQYGTGSVPVLQGLLAAAAFMKDLGLERVARWDAMLTARLRTGLAAIPKARLSSPADPRLAAAITTFRVEGVTARALQDALWARRIRVRAQGDDRGVRLSAHLYVSPANIDTILEVARGL